MRGEGLEEVLFREAERGGKQVSRPGLAFQDDAVACLAGAQVVESVVYVVHCEGFGNRGDLVTGAEVQHRGNSGRRAER